jgi:predicted DNA-binding transcriptional regulator AlpA
MSDIARPEVAATSLKLLRPKAVLRALGVSRPTLYRLMKSDPGFPRAIRLGANSIAFVEAELIAWLHGRRAK